MNGKHVRVQNPSLVDWNGLGLNRGSKKGCECSRHKQKRFDACFFSPSQVSPPTQHFLVASFVDL